MRAITTLTSKLFENLPTVHKARKTSLAFAIEALCEGGKLSLKSLDRAREESASLTVKVP